MEENKPLFEVTENMPSTRFELAHEGDLVGFAEYHQRDHDVLVTHVETLRPFRGQGYASKLMAGMLDLLRESERTITPVCPYAAGYMSNNPDQRDLLTVRP